MTESKHREAVCSQVARLLREARRKRGLSMTELAARAGLSHAMISFVERELRNPTLDTMLRVCAVMEVKLGELLTQATKEADSTIKPRRRTTKLKD